MFLVGIRYVYTAVLNCNLALKTVPFARIELENPYYGQLITVVSRETFSPR